MGITDTYNIAKKCGLYDWWESGDKNYGNLIVIIDRIIKLSIEEYIKENGHLSPRR